MRENEGKSKSNYPQLIKYLILIYSNQQDHFDPKATHKLIQISGNTIIDARGVFKGDGNQNSYLRNIVTEGIHIWKFTHVGSDNNDKKFAQIGVWKTNSGDPCAGVLDEYLDNTTEDDKTCTGYAITPNGFRTDPQNVSSWSTKQYHADIQHGEIIVMILDLKKMKLKFKVNDRVIVKFVDIENTSYRAAVSTYEAGDSFTLISYQDIY